MRPLLFCMRVSAAVALVALLGSACGHGDDIAEAPASPVELSVDEAVVQAVAIAGEHSGGRANTTSCLVPRG